MDDNKFLNELIDWLEDYREKNKIPDGKMFGL